MPEKKATKKRSPVLKPEQTWKLKDHERVVRILEVSEDRVVAEYIGGVPEEQIGKKIYANPRRFKEKWRKQK